MALTKDIVPHLTALANAAIAALGSDATVTLAPPPNAEMGDLGFPCFPLARALRKSPQQCAEAVAEALRPRAEGDPLVAEIVVAGPYVNFKLALSGVLTVVLEELRGEHPIASGLVEPGERVMIEFSSPNTNKPQHLGHIRNNLLGHTVASILAHAGHQVIRANLINDRGIHICKSMLAYQRFGAGETPESSGKKGDHLVGDYYVIFSAKLDAEYKAWLASADADAVYAAWLGSPGARRALEGWSKAHTPKGQPKVEPDEAQKRDLFRSSWKDDYFNERSELGAAAREMLRRWEDGDAETRALWRRMNDWVEAGFDATYRRMGVWFDRIDHESETYLLGKDLVEEGAGRGVFHRAENGATVFDLAKIGLSGEKAVLRPDGTSLYTTQDLGTAVARFEANQLDRLIYVVGDEQNHHFQVLFGILGQLREGLTERCHHLSYGMVLLPDGRMKSREGNVVDADDLMDEVQRLATHKVRESWPDLDEAEVTARSTAIGDAAIKFFLLNFTPQTSFTFDPERSVEFEGQTGPYLQYAYARTCSILNKAGLDPEVGPAPEGAALAALGTELERGLILHLMTFPAAVLWGASKYDPSKIADFAYQTARWLARIFSDDTGHNVLKSAEPRRTALLQLMWAVNRTLKVALGLLGIQTLNRM